MTLKQKRQFIRSLCNSVKKELILKAGKFPENWDGHELREIIARKFINERTLDKKENCKRLRQFAVDYYSSNL